MKKHTQLFTLSAGILLSVALIAPSHAASFDCKKAKSYAEKTVCSTPQLSNLDDLLAASFIKVMNSTSDQKTLKAEEHDWLVNERNVCTDVDCLKTAYKSRIAVLNDLVASAETPTHSSSSTNSSMGQWYQAIAKPSLVVRASPDVTGKSLGNIPTGGKVKVVAATGKNDFIGGRNGAWVKIEWQGKTAYVFDAFLEKIGAQTSSKNQTDTSKPSKTTPKPTTTGKTLSGEITSYDCGDNCYLTVTDSKGDEHIGLCTASTCDAWNENAAMPDNFLHKKVKVTLGKGTQVDAAGNAMGDMDAFDVISFLN
jgi:uncharacterized protein